MGINVFISTGGEVWALLTYDKITDESIGAISEWYAWGLMHWPGQKSVIKGLSDENTEKVRRAAKKLVEKDKGQHVMDEENNESAGPPEKQDGPARTQEK